MAPDLSFPCFVLMRERKLVDRGYGMELTQEPEAFFRAWINKHINDPQVPRCPRIRSSMFEALHPPTPG